MNFNDTTLWLAAGWTMLHFLWVGGFIRVGAAIVRRTLRGASAETRYAAALSSLALLALAPGAIAWRLSQGDRTERLPRGPESIAPGTSHKPSSLLDSYRADG